MTGVVVDASVAIKWVVEEEGSEAAVRLLDGPLTAPDLLCPECANILWKKVVRGELSPEEAEAAAAAFELADVALHPMRRHFRTASALSITLKHPAYDCFYLALAEALDLPLVTADNRLVRAVEAGPSSRFAARVLPLSDLP